MVTTQEHAATGLPKLLTPAFYALPPDTGAGYLPPRQHPQAVTDRRLQPLRASGEPARAVCARRAVSEPTAAEIRRKTAAAFARCGTFPLP